SPIFGLYVPAAVVIDTSTVWYFRGPAQAQSGGDTAAHRTAVVTSRTVKNHCDFLSYNIHILQIQSGKHQAKRRKIWWK
ncbi:TPA: hypothetical protein ACIVYD_004793, partial [Salmonella enterica subsp. enterica serovar Birkenhead]